MTPTPTAPPDYAAAIRAEQERHARRDARISARYAVRRQAVRG